MAIDRAHLASRLRTSMLERGLSQAELARQSGVDPAPPFKTPRRLPQSSPRRLLNLQSSRLQRA